MDYIIRELRLDDLKNNSFFETLSNLRVVGDLDPDLAEKIFKDCAAKGIITLVAEKEGKVIGSIRLLFEQKYYHGGALAGHIEDVSTHKDHLRKGVASTLIRRAIDLCRQKNCYKVILDCSDDFVGFYQKLGFEPNGHCLRFNLQETKI